MAEVKRATGICPAREDANKADRGCLRYAQLYLCLVRFKFRLWGQILLHQNPDGILLCVLKQSGMKTNP